MNPAHDKAMLDLAARAAWRAAGYVEPNPPVGCVLAREENGAPRVIGIGHHRYFGGPHAEVDALADCAARAESPMGATAYVTLEPCNGHGKQPPCSEALVRAGVREVVAARRDPNPQKSGGAERLRSAGIEVRLTSISPRATRLTDPFIKRLASGLPYVIAKWAQSIDGRVATASGESQWISGEASRRRVHRMRARVDAILTGIGTVRTDRPRLTARGVHVRRIARRVVIDPRFELADERLGESLAADLPRAPLLIACSERALGEGRAAAERWRARGAEVMALPPARHDASAGLDVRSLLAHLVQRHNAANVLVEAGPSTVGRLLRDDLVDEVQVYVGPMIIGDGPGPADRLSIASLAAARRFELYEHRRIGDDVRLTYRKPLAGV